MLAQSPSTSSECCSVSAVYHVGAAHVLVYLQGPALLSHMHLEICSSLLLLQLLLDLSLVVTGTFNIHCGLCSPLAAVLAQGGTELHSCHT